MADYTDFEAANAALVNSKSGAASLSFGDANYDGVKHHDASRLQNTVVITTSIVGLLALASVGTALVAMYLEGSILIYVCFALPLMLAPFIVYQRSRLQWLPGKLNSLCMYEGSFLSSKVFCGLTFFSSSFSSSDMLQHFVRSLTSFG